MATLEIRKKTSKVWQHVSSDFGTYIVSKMYCKTDGNTFKITEHGGAKRGEYNITEVTIYDDTVSGGAETFATPLLLMKRLEALSYVGFYYDGDVIPADLISTDASNTLILGSDRKLYSAGGGGVSVVKDFSLRTNTPIGNASTTISNNGAQALTLYGTLQGETMVGGGYYKSIKKLSAKTPATAGSSAGWRNGSVYSVLNYENEWEHIIYFGNSSPTFVSDTRLFVGFRSVLSTIGNVEPSILGTNNIVGVGFDSTYTNFHFYATPLGTSAATYDLGSLFPKNTVNADFFMFKFHKVKNSYDVILTLKNMLTGDEISQTITYDVSKNDTVLLENIWINNNSSNEEARISFGDNINKSYY